MPTIQQLLELLIRVDTGDLSKVTEGLNQVNTNAGKSQDAARATSAEYLNLATSMKAAGASASEVSTVLKDSGQSAAQISGILKQVGFKELDEDVKRATPNLAQWRTEIRAGSQAISGLGVDTFAAGRAISGIDTLLLSGTAATAAFGVAAAGAAAFIVKEGAELDNAQAKLQAWGNLSVSQSQAVGQAFLAQAGTVTASAAEMVGALATVAPQLELINRGSLTVTQSVEFMAAAYDLSAATGTKLAAATSALASIQVTFGHDTAQAAQDAGTLAAILELTGAPAESLSTVIGRLHDRFGPLAPDLESTGVLLVQLEQAGVTGQRGLMLVSTAADHLLANGKETKAELDALGVSLFNADGSAKPFPATLQAIATAEAGMSDAQRSAANQALFGASAGVALDTVLKNYLSTLGPATQAVQAHSDAKKQAATQESTLTGEIGKGLAAIKDWAAGVNEALGQQRDWNSSTGDVTAKVDGLTVTVSRARIEHVGYANALAEASAQHKVTQADIDGLIKSGGQLAATFHDESTEVDLAAAAHQRLDSAVKILSADLSIQNGQIRDSAKAFSGATAEATVLSAALYGVAAAANAVAQRAGPEQERERTAAIQAQATAYTTTTQAQGELIRGNSVLAGLYNQLAAAQQSQDQPRIQALTREISLEQTREAVASSAAKAETKGENEAEAAARRAIQATEQQAAAVKTLIESENQYNAALGITRTVTQQTVDADRAAWLQAIEQLRVAVASGTQERIKLAQDEVAEKKSTYDADEKNFKAAEEAKKAEAKAAAAEAKASANAASQAVLTSANDERAFRKEAFAEFVSLQGQMPDVVRSALAQAQGQYESYASQVLQIDQQLQRKDLPADERATLEEHRRSLEGWVAYYGESVSQIESLAQEAAKVQQETDAETTRYAKQMADDQVAVADHVASQKKALADAERSYADHQHSAAEQAQSDNQSIADAVERYNEVQEKAAGESRKWSQAAIDLAHAHQAQSQEITALTSNTQSLIQAEQKQLQVQRDLIDAAKEQALAGMSQAERQSQLEQDQLSQQQQQLSLQQQQLSLQQQKGTISKDEYDAQSKALTLQNGELSVQKDQLGLQRSQFGLQKDQIDVYYGPAEDSLKQQEGSLKRINDALATQNSLFGSAGGGGASGGSSTAGSSSSGSAEKTQDELKKAAEGVAKAVAKANKDAADSAAKMAEDWNKSIGSIQEAETKWSRDHGQKMIDIQTAHATATKKITDDSNTFAAMLASVLGPDESGAFPRLGQTVTQQANTITASMGQMRVNVGTSVSGMARDSQTTITQMATDIADPAQKAGSTIGTSVDLGIVQGLQSLESEVASAGGALVGDLFAAMRAAAGVASPSKEAHTMAGFIGQGFIQGFSAQRSGVAQAASDMVHGALQPLVSEVQGDIQEIFTLKGQLAGNGNTPSQIADWLQANVLPTLEAQLAGMIGGHGLLSERAYLGSHAPVVAVPSAGSGDGLFSAGANGSDILGYRPPSASPVAAGTQVAPIGGQPGQGAPIHIYLDGTEATQFISARLENQRRAEATAVGT